MLDKIIAHIREKDGKIQSLWEHLTNVSSYCKQFTAQIGMQEIGEIMGLFHDLGKASSDFQNYIRSSNGLIAPGSDDYLDPIAHRGKIDHSSAGAQWIYQNLDNDNPAEAITTQILSLCIASHHSGLIDCISTTGVDSFTKRINKPDEFTHLQEATTNLDWSEKELLERLLSNISVRDQLIEKLKKIQIVFPYQDTASFAFGLLIRFLFSCLIDADRLDTADFEMPENLDIRNYGIYRSWAELIERLNHRLKEFELKENRNEIDHLRTQVSQNCLEFSTRPKGIYRLEVPTGGGKTLASLRFALNHANHHHLQRIFYIIPFTSIIDQNADEVRNILEDRDTHDRFLDQVVLEHHSNLTPEEETHRQYLLAQNWDAPVIFTTMVQFLETLFGSGTRSARRMHQLANAVIIFDEVQSIPVRCVHMFNMAIRFLVEISGSTAILCTATQPLLDRIEPAHRSLPIKQEQKIISDEKLLFDNLKRVEVYDGRKVGGWTDEEITQLAKDELIKKGSVLMIVNTRSAARSLYEAVSQRELAPTYHLSTNMCPAHRLKILNEVRKLLENKQPVLCVSTQLIEAGIDIDFGSVIRYLAGLDSIVQAAGRCNRHGKHSSGNVWVVNPQNENIERLKDIKIGVEITGRVLDEFIENPSTFEHDLIGPNALTEFYRYYFYRRKDEMCYRVGPNSPAGNNDDLFNLLSMNTHSVEAYQRGTNSAPHIPFKQAFQTAAQCFYAIDSPTRGVIVPYEKEGKNIIIELCGISDIKRQFHLLKQAQRYSVNLYPYQFDRLANELQAIHEIQKNAGVFYLDSQFYSNMYGWCDELVNDQGLLTY